MATHAAVKARRIAGNAAGVVGIELLAAAQGLDFHAPLASSPPIEAARGRKSGAQVPHLESDRCFAPELEWAKEAVLSGAFAGEVEGRLFAQ